MKKPQRWLTWTLSAILFIGAGAGTARAGTEAPSRAKYVFLMIGDGMGADPLRLFESQCGPMTLASFAPPVPTGTDNVQGKTTDSAASGTALACVIKTYNGAMGMNADRRPVTSLAKLLQQRGYKIGIASTVGINDATPGTHYANRKTRRQHAGILSDLVASRFDFFGVDRVLWPAEYRRPDFEKLLRPQGYAVADGPALSGLDPAAKNVVFLPLMARWDDAPRPGPSLADLTREAARVLRNDAGFFLMVEGGAIDHFCHNNDAAGAIREMLEFDAAVAAALAFRREHPDDTLVVVTADHDTGGLDFVPGKTPTPGFWKRQTMPHGELQRRLAQMKKENADARRMIDWCLANVGLDQPTDEENAAFRQGAELFLADQTTVKDKLTGYGGYNPLLVEVLRARDARAGIRFTTFGHTNRPIMTRTAGVGAERFAAPLENSDIPHRIAVAMLGTDEPLKQAAGQIPFPPNNAKSDLSWQSATPDSLTLRYGLVAPHAHDLAALSAAGMVLANPDGTIHRQAIAGAFGRATFVDLTPDTEYTLVVGGPRDRSLASAVAGKVRTPRRPAGERRLRLAVVADPHVADMPDHFGRLYSRSADLLTAVAAKAAEAECDAMLIPGDLTGRGLASEMKLAGKALAGFKGTVIAAPGNHDTPNGAQAAEWQQGFGATAGIKEMNGIQLLWLDTHNGKLANPGNREAIERLDPARPAVIISHYQLVRDAYIQDDEAAVDDRDAPENRELLDKLGRAKAVLYVGHKNTASTARLGGVTQINLPQPLEFPNGFLILDTHDDGVLQRYVPSSDAYVEEYSRRMAATRAGRAEARNRHALAAWNGFLSWPTP